MFHIIFLSHTVIKAEGTDHVTGAVIAQVDSHFSPIPGTEQHLNAQKDDALSYYGSAREYYIAGDCTGPEDVMKATQTAFATAVKV